jgi:hypothetical protein
MKVDDTMKVLERSSSDLIILGFEGYKNFKEDTGNT